MQLSSTCEERRMIRPFQVNETVTGIIGVLKMSFFVRNPKKNFTAETKKVKHRSSHLT